MKTIMFVTVLFLAGAAHGDYHAAGMKALTKCAAVYKHAYFTVSTPGDTESLRGHDCFVGHL